MGGAGTLRGRDTWRAREEDKPAVVLLLFLDGEGLRGVPIWTSGEKVSATCIRTELKGRHRGLGSFLGTPLLREGVNEGVDGKRRWQNQFYLEPETLTNPSMQQLKATAANIWIT